jgi:hypothetical protein
MEEIEKATIALPICGVVESNEPESQPTEFAMQFGLDDALFWGC